MNPELLRRLPKMDLLLARPALAEHPLPYPVKRQAARQVLDDCRRQLDERLSLRHLGVCPYCGCDLKNREFPLGKGAK